MELRRVNDLPLYVFDLVDEWKAEARAGGADVIDFGIGSPDQPTSAPIVDRLVAEARRDENHGYPTSAGLGEVRAALAAWYERRHGVVIDDATQALVTWGASDALAHLPWVLLEAGDSALVPEPCYPIHRHAVEFSGARAFPVTIEAENDLGEAVARAYGDAARGEGAKRPPRLLLLSFPHNPTTRCVELDTFARLVAWARSHEVVIVHDFAYADIAFDGYRPPSILQVPGAADVAVEVVSLSKSHNMAGWRLGFVAGNATVIAGLRRLKSYLDYGVTRPIQLMGLTALSPACDGVAAEASARYQRRRDQLCSDLTALGWPVAAPRGTMFVWAPLPERLRGKGSGRGSLAFAERLLREAHVAVTPGVAFGQTGDGHVRFALVQPRERIAQALERIGQVLSATP